MVILLPRLTKTKSQSRDLQNDQQLGFNNWFSVLLEMISILVLPNLFFFLLVQFAKFVSAVWPTMPVTKVTHGSGSRNPAVTKWESEDPLRFHGHVSNTLL